MSELALKRNLLAYLRLHLQTMPALSALPGAVCKYFEGGKKFRIVLLTALTIAAAAAATALVLVSTCCMRVQASLSLSVLYARRKA